MDESDLSRRRFLRATGATAAAATLAGCSSGDSNTNRSDGNNGSGSGSSEKQSTPATTERESTEGNASEGNESGGQTTEKGPGKTNKTVQLTVGTMTTFDPIAATDGNSKRVTMNVFDALTNYPNGQTTIENLLASEFQTSNGEKTYTFTLKDGVKFSNGDTLTASDFVYSFERLAASEHSKRASFLLGDLGVKHQTDSKGNYKPKSMAVRAKDERTLVIELSQPNPSALEILGYAAFSAVPEGIVGDIEGVDGEISYEKFASSNPIGAGPYTLDTYKSGTEAAITARSDYHGKGPMTAGTHWKIVSKTNAEYAYTVSNRNADAPTIPNAKYDPSKEQPEGTDDTGYEYGTYGPLTNGLSADFYRTEELATSYIGFNCQVVPQYVRKAVAYANNNQEIIESIYKKPQRSAYHFVPPKMYPDGRSAYTDHAKNNYPYGYKQTQFDKAQQLMEDNGHGPNNPYKLTMTALPDSVTKRILNLLRDKLRNVHIEMTIKQTTVSTLIEQVYSGNTEGFTLSWTADWPQPSNFLNLVYPPATNTSSDGNGSGFNWMNTESANKAKNAYEKIQNNSQPKAGQQARNEGVVSMLEAVWEGVPMVTTIHEVNTYMEYPWFYKPKAGAMGLSRTKHNTYQIGERKK